MRWVWSTLVLVLVALVLGYLLAHSFSVPTP
jgi:hypothetical protein